MAKLDQQLKQISHFLAKYPTFLIPIVLVLLACVATLGGISSNIAILNSDALIKNETWESPTVTARFTSSDQELILETATNADAWAQGLMFRSNLSANQGMIFVFPDSQIRNFWMKNTYIPLDIIYLDSQLNVVDLYINTVPLQTDITYPSRLPAKYVVELASGSSSKLNIQQGTKLIIDNVQ